MHEIGTVVSNNSNIPFSVIRSRKRRTVGLYVDPERGVYARAPAHVPLERIRMFLQDKADWIRKRQANFAKVRLRRVKREYESGETFFFLGEVLRLEVRASGSLTRVTREGGRLCVRLLASSITPESHERVRRAVVGWYRQEAARVLEDRLSLFASRMGVSVARFSLGQAKTSWGTCSARGRVRFNWQIVAAPLEIVDYIVVHELAHRIHLDHSSEFWALVGAFIPDYKERRRRLRVEGAGYVV